ncbi:MAG TPA: glycosyltransferase family 4 protein [Candidatus Thalassarchaeaceae archaeon]|nr:glycosyltransferase family 4 protein [Candidatus Thalassarchaeaceae archaeon]
MHIAMISAEYPPRWGGMGSTVFHLSSILAELGHRVSVITRSSRDEPPHIEGVKVIPVSWAPIPMVFTRSYGKNALRSLEALHSEDPVDVVHLHCPMISWDDNQFDRCRSAVAPVVSSMHGTWLGERDGLLLAAKHGEPAVWANPNDMAIRYLANRFSKFEESAIRKSNVVVPNSFATKEDLEERYSPPVDWDCEVIHWGVDTRMFTPLHRDSEDEMIRCREVRERYGLNPNSTLILAVGRLAARKGHGMLLRSFARAKPSNCKLLIVGRGNLRKKLMRLATKLGISDRVIIEPSLRFDELAELYRFSDLVIYPSYYEGQGLIPLEAMSSGVPVATVDHGPLPEMVDESVGSLFRMGDIDSMCEAIMNGVESRVEMRRKGVEGRKRILERFTLRSNAESFESTYKRAIGLI